MDHYNWHQSYAPITMGGPPYPYAYTPVTMKGLPHNFNYFSIALQEPYQPSSCYLQWCETQSEFQTQNHQSQIQSFMEDLQVRLEQVAFAKFMTSTTSNTNPPGICEPPPVQFQPPTPPAQSSFQSQKEHSDHQIPTNPRPFSSSNQNFKCISQSRGPPFQLTQHISPPFMSSTENFPQTEQISTNFRSSATSIIDSQTGSAPARQLFDVMLKRNLISFNSIFDWYVKLGVMKLTPDMLENAEVKLNLSYWNTIRCGYSKSKHGFKVAWKLLFTGPLCKGDDMFEYILVTLSVVVQSEHNDEWLSIHSWYILCVDPQQLEPYVFTKLHEHFLNGYLVEGRSGWQPLFAIPRLVTGISLPVSPNTDDKLKNWQRETRHVEDDIREGAEVEPWRHVSVNRNDDRGRPLTFSEGEIREQAFPKTNETTVDDYFKKGGNDASDCEVVEAKDNVERRLFVKPIEKTRIISVLLCRIEMRDVIKWTTMIHGYAELGGSLFNLLATQLSVVVSGSLYGALLGSILVYTSADFLGMRRELTAAVLNAFGSLINVYAPGLGVLLIGQPLYGLGIGLVMYGASLYMARTYPSQNRGPLISLKEILIVLGIFVGSIQINASGGWQYMYGLSAPIVLLVGLGMWSLPPSPRLFILQAVKGKGSIQEIKEKVIFSLSKLRGRPVDDTVSEKQMDNTLVSLKSAYADEESEGSFIEVFQGPSLKAFIINIGGLVPSQQTTSQPSDLYYAGPILQSVGFSAASDATRVSVVIGAFKLLMTGIAVLKVDDLGQRPLLIRGVELALSLFPLSSYYRFLGGFPLVVAAALLLYVGCYLYFGPINWPWTYQLTALCTFSGYGWDGLGSIYFTGYIISVNVLIMSEIESQHRGC